MKLPKALQEQLGGLQEEIAVRQRQAQQETVAAYALLMFLCESHPAHDEMLETNEQYLSDYELIGTRYRQLMEETKDA